MNPARIRSSNAGQYRPPSRSSRPAPIRISQYAYDWLRPVLALLLALCCAGLAWPATAATNVQPRERVGTGIQVNQLRQFDIDSATVITLDGEPLAGPVTRERVGTGMRIRARAAANANAALTTGTLAELAFENALKGPVTAVQPLQVLGQPVTVTADTVLQNFATIGQLAVGQSVEVAGFLDTNSSAVAARLKLLPNGATSWRLTGFVSAIAPNQLTVGTQRVDISGVAAQDCAAPPAVGDYVELRAVPDPGFVAGQVLAGVQRLRCLTPAPLGTPGASGAIEGLVSAVDAPTAFRLGPLAVNHGPDTLFQFGNAGDIDFGVRLEVEGSFITATAFDARRIRFVRPRIRIEAPADPAAVVLGQSVTVLGEVVRFNAQLRDEDGIYASGIPAPRQLELRAYVDSAGQLYASRARIRRDQPRPDDIRLQGPVHDVAAPAFGILGITVLTDPATLFRDRSGALVDAATFFAALQDGVMVEATDATYDAPSRTLRPAEVQLGDDDLGAAALRAQPLVEGGADGRVEGTVTGFEPDALSIDGFE